jgi:hypothetical protein
LVGSDITVSGGGTVAVATDELHDIAQRLELAAHNARSARQTLATLDGDGWTVGVLRGSPPHQKPWEREADQALERSALLLAECEFRAETAARALRFAATVYGIADNTIDLSMRRLSGILGYGVGALAPILLALMASFALTAAPGLLLGACAARLWQFHDPRRFDEVRQGVGSWFGEQRALLTNPVTVALIGNLMTSTDDFTAGVLRIPPALAMFLGEEGIAVAGISSSALTAIVLGGQAGFLREGGVVAQRTSTRTLERAPSGLRERVDRLPSPDDNAHGEQIRIDRFSVPGQPDRFEVFIAGTVDFSPLATTEPFDLTSNIHSIAQLPAGSDRAVREAMNHAGVTATSPVIFTGHSQGGMIAANLAASGDFRTHGVVTIGAPDGAIVIGADVPVIALVHSDDLVTVLNGPRKDPGTIVVERQAFAQRSVPDDVVLPAHDRVEYRQTAASADLAADESLRTAISQLDRMTAGATPVSSSLYQARRTVLPESQ